jgi:hypothetical protein
MPSKTARSGSGKPLGWSGMPVAIHPSHSGFRAIQKIGTVQARLGDHPGKPGLDLSEETRRPLGAHIWRKEPTGFYVEPTWVSQRLFEVEKFSGTVWDSACGLGRIPEAARAAGYATFASDLIDRGYRYFDEALNFLACEHRLGDNIVTNPPSPIPTL